MKKKRFVHVAIIIAAAVPARIKTVTIAVHTSKQSRRIERFLLSSFFCLVFRSTFGGSSVSGAMTLFLAALFLVDG